MLNTDPNLIDEIIEKEKRVIDIENLYPSKSIINNKNIIKRLFVSDYHVLWEIERNGETLYLIHQGIQTLKLKSTEKYREVTEPMILYYMKESHNKIMLDVFNDKENSDGIKQYAANAILYFKEDK